MDDFIVKKPITRESPARPGRDQALSPSDIDIAINTFIESRYEHNAQGHINDYRLYQHFVIMWKSIYKGTAIPTKHQLRTALLLKGYRFDYVYPVKWVDIAMKKQ